MQAAFAAGASVVEIDIAPTTDGVLAVFHDWELDCRTNGSGAIRAKTWAELASLDIGHGYTRDGETFPLRGKGIGLMPRLEAVFARFPDGQFLINFKSNDPAEAALLEEVVAAQGATHQVWAVYGAPVAVDAYVAATGARGFSEDSIRACFSDYLDAGDDDDDDVVLASCQDTAVIVPVDLAPLLPGWPDAFVQSMDRHGTEVIVSGPGVTGIDTRSELDLLAPSLDVYVWTNEIDALT